MNKYIKNILYSFHEYSFESIVNRIRTCDVVSFDIFDTLIKRTVYDSSNIYLLTARRYNKRTTSNIDEAQFKIDRLEAANKAEVEAFRSNVEEITLEEIYEKLPSSYTAFKDQLMKDEIATEIECCKENPVLQKIFEWCLENEKRVILTSDMYLTEDTICDILTKNGYVGYEKLYLSSVLKVKKSTGNIFKLILKDFKGHSIIHIGDSLRSDYLNPKKNGLSAVLITPHPDRTSHCRICVSMDSTEKAIYKKIKSLMSSHINPEWDEFYKYGYEVLGPLLFGFSMWLSKELKKGGFQRVFFMSRDGYLLMKAYEMLSSASRSTYFYVSRRSLAVPLLCINDGLSGLIKSNDLGKKWNCRMLSYRLGIDYDTSLKAWIQCGLDVDEAIRGYSILDDDRVLNFYKKVESLVIENSKVELSLLKSYFDEIGFNGNVAIVDTGGNCTSQKNLNVLSEFDIGARVSGFYLWTKNTQSLKAKSFPITEEELKFGNMTIAEFFLTSHEGSTQGYKIDCENICATKRKYEHDANTDEIIKKVQDGALKFVEIFRDSEFIGDFTEIISKNNIIAFSKYPTYRQASMMSELDVFNDDCYEKMNSPQKLLYYLGHPRELKNDLYAACWKIGFIKKLMVIPCNYYFLLKMADKKIKKGYGRL